MRKFFLLATLPIAAITSGACHDQRPNAPQAVAPPRGSLASDPSLSSTPPASASAPAVTSPPKSTGPDLGTYTCGKNQCRVKYEVCCDFSFSHTSGFCAPLPESTQRNTSAEAQAEDPEDTVEALCTKVKGGPTIVSYQECRDSTQCAANRVCSPHEFGRFPGRIKCRPKGESTEVCTEGSCRYKGTTCREGECTLAESRVRCGAALCSGVKSLCCEDGGKLTCVDPTQKNACYGYPYQCRNQADCGGDYVCGYDAEHGASCAVSIGSSARLCSDDKECLYDWKCKPLVRNPNTDGSRVPVKFCAPY